MSKIKPRKSIKNALLILSGFLALAALVLWISVLVLPVALHKPSETDAQRLSILEKKYGDKFSFKLVDEFYLNVRSKHGAEADEEEIEAIYRAFFFDEAMKGRRDTSYVYLNFYDSKGKFQYQLYYASAEESFGKNNAEYY